MGHTVDSITLLGRAHKQISAERKEHLKPVLNEDIRTLCDKETSDSKYLFGENLLESMILKNLLEFQIVLLTTILLKFKKLVTSQALSVLLGTQMVVLVPGFLLPIL